MNDYKDILGVNHIHQNFPVHDDWRRDNTARNAMQAFMRELAAERVLLESRESRARGKIIDVIKPPVQQTKPSIYGTSPRRVK